MKGKEEHAKCVKSVCPVVLETGHFVVCFQSAILEFMETDFIDLIEMWLCAVKCETCYLYFLVTVSSIKCSYFCVCRIL